MGSSAGEVNSRSGDEVLDGSGGENLVWVCKGRDASPTCTAIPARSAPRISHSPVWIPACSVKLKFVCRCDDCLGYRMARAGPSKVAKKMSSPALISLSVEGVELGRGSLHHDDRAFRSRRGRLAVPRGRSIPNYVCEEHGGEHSGVEGMRSSTRNEFFDHVSKFKCVSAYRLCSRCEYEARSSNVLSQILRRRSEHGVVGRAKYERWCLNEREDIAYVSLVNRETRNGG